MEATILGRGFRHASGIILPVDRGTCAATALDMGTWPQPTRISKAAFHAAKESLPLRQINVCVYIYIYIFMGFRGVARLGYYPAGDYIPRK